MAGSKKQPCSIRDVAEHAGVSAGTVSRILNKRLGTMRIPEATRRKVARIARELNYAPNINARRLFSRKTGIIGLLTPSSQLMGWHIFNDGHLTRTISGLTDVLTVHHYRLLLLVNDEAFMKKREFLQVFRESQMDGLVIWGAYEHEKEWEELAASGYPYLFLNNLPATTTPANYVTSDYTDAGFQAANYLLARGCRRLAWIGGKEGISLNRQQEAGVARAIAEQGGDARLVTKLSAGGYDLAEGVAVGRQLLATGAAFDGVVAANHHLAAGVMQCLLESGRRVPEEVALVACHSVWDQDEYRGTVPRIRVNSMAMGEAAAHGLLRLIKDPGVRVQETIPVELAADSPVAVIPNPPPKAAAVPPPKTTTRGSRR
ncbi:MAG: LacI family DNA-binding transcriptional regulator [Lentisphaeria bacterium]